MGSRARKAAVAKGLVVIASFALAACGPSERTVRPSGGRGLATAGGPADTADAGGPASCTRETTELEPCVADCNRNIAPACVRLAERFEHAEGTPRDVPRAVTMRERACDLGDVGSCVLAARMYGSGSGVVPNRARQVDYWVAACKLGEAHACASAGKALRRGDGVPRDEARARDADERGCVAGIEETCARLQDGGV